MATCMCREPTDPAASHSYISHIGLSTMCCRRVALCSSTNQRRAPNPAMQHHGCIVHIRACMKPRCPAHTQDHPTQPASPPARHVPTVLQRGDEGAETLRDVQRFYMVLEPSKEGSKSRLAVVGRKRLPSVEKKEASALYFPAPVSPSPADHLLLLNDLGRPACLSSRCTCCGPLAVMKPQPTHQPIPLSRCCMPAVLP